MSHVNIIKKMATSPQYGFCFAASFQLLDVTLSLFVYLQNATFLRNLSFVSIF